MKTMFAGPTLYGKSKFEDTELALAISPCPQINGSKETGESADIARRGGEPGRRDQAHWSQPLDDDELTETLTSGWAIALAIADPPAATTSRHLVTAATCIPPLWLKALNPT